VRTAIFQGDAWCPSVEVTRGRRVLTLVGLAGLHVLLYFLVNRISEARPADVWIDFSISLDERIPFLPWTWVVYYGGDLFIVGFAAWVLWRLPDAAFRRASIAYAAMMLLAATIQVLFPGPAPWPAEFTAAQAWGHAAAGMHRFATFPSMHVALSVLPACLSLSVLRRPSARGAAVLAALVISLSTLTLKEHLVLDAVAGAILALGAWWWWRRGISHDTMARTP